MLIGVVKSWRHHLSSTGLHHSSNATTPWQLLASVSIGLVWWAWGWHDAVLVLALVCLMSWHSYSPCTIHSYRAYNITICWQARERMSTRGRLHSIPPQLQTPACCIKHAEHVLVHTQNRLYLYMNNNKTSKKCCCHWIQEIETWSKEWWAVIGEGLSYDRVLKDCCRDQVQPTHGHTR